jgi:hypothetical protein
MLCQYRAVRIARSGVVCDAWKAQDKYSRGENEMKRVSVPTLQDQPLSRTSVVSSPGAQLAELAEMAELACGHLSDNAGTL